MLLNPSLKVLLKAFSWPSKGLCEAFNKRLLRFFQKPYFKKAIMGGKIDIQIMFFLLFGGMVLGQFMEN